MPLVEKNVTFKNIKNREKMFLIFKFYFWIFFIIKNLVSQPTNPWWPSWAIIFVTHLKVSQSYSTRLSFSP